MVIVPLTVLLIFLVLYVAFRSVKWPIAILLNVAMAPIGGILALVLTGTHFSVSSGVGFPALSGVSVQTGVIMVEYINQLRARGLGVDEATIEGAVLRLRPIMMTALVASPGAAAGGTVPRHRVRLAAAIRPGHRGGLLTNLAISVFLLPTLYTVLAGRSDLAVPLAMAEAASPRSRAGASLAAGRSAMGNDARNVQGPSGDRGVEMWTARTVVRSGDARYSVGA